MPLERVINYIITSQFLSNTTQYRCNLYVLARKMTWIGAQTFLTHNNGMNILNHLCDSFYTQYSHFLILKEAWWLIFSHLDMYIFSDFISHSNCTAHLLPTEHKVVSPPWPRIYHALRESKRKTTNPIEHDTNPSKRQGRWWGSYCRSYAYIEWMHSSCSYIVKW